MTDETHNVVKPLLTCTDVNDPRTVDLSDTFNRKDSYLIDFSGGAGSCTVATFLIIALDHKCRYNKIEGRRMDMAAGPWEPVNPQGQEQYPESMTAALAAEDEEYLAWLADHHWPDDEYFELEHDWRAEIEIESAAGSEISARSACPGCRSHAADVWPCRKCGRLLHSACGNGMRRRTVQPYRTRDMDNEVVLAEWVCTGCSSVVGLDVGHADDA